MWFWIIAYRVARTLLICLAFSFGLSATVYAKDILHAPLDGWSGIDGWRLQVVRTYPIPMPFESEQPGDGGTRPLSMLKNNILAWK